MQNDVGRVAIHWSKQRRDSTLGPTHAGFNNGHDPRPGPLNPDKQIDKKLFGVRLVQENANNN